MSNKPLTIIPEHKVCVLLIGDSWAKRLKLEGICEVSRRYPAQPDIEGYAYSYYDFGDCIEHILPSMGKLLMAHIPFTCHCNNT